jgi:transketolase
MSDRDSIVAGIEAMAKRMRKTALDVALGAGGKSAHIGGALSIVDITATLFGAVMRLDPKNPEWPDRDRFILSKGHGVLGYYTALAEAGFIPLDELMKFEETGSYLLGHPVMNRPKGIEFSNGSLGMGLSLGIGVSISARRRNQDFRVFVVMGDGECNEGSVWEAAMAAAHFKLKNLVAIIDRNNLQQTGTNADIMSIGDVAAKFTSFGWRVIELDGHDAGALYDTLNPRNTADQPLAIVAHTVKGKGFSFTENNNDWHHAVLTRTQYDTAMQELNG